MLAEIVGTICHEHGESYFDGDHRYDQPTQLSPIAHFATSFPKIEERGSSKGKKPGKEFSLPGVVLINLLCILDNLSEFLLGELEHFYSLAEIGIEVDRILR